MEKVMNFRDLGGMTSEDGRRVKKGLFFRSALLDDANVEDIAYLSGLKIAVVLDYRDLDEAVASSEKSVETLIGAEHVKCATEYKNQKLYKLKKAKGIGKLFHTFTLEDVQGTYRCLPFDNEGYKTMVKCLEEGKVPFLQHCSAGKDRAGFGCALLLTILGVDYSEILEDYLKSAVFEDYVREKVAGHIPWVVRKFLIKKYQILFTVDERLLAAAFEEIKLRYGTIESYLLAEFGLTTEKIAQLRDLYLE